MMLFVDRQAGWLFAWSQRPTRVNRKFTRIDSGDHTLVFKVDVEMILVSNSKFWLAVKRNCALYRLAPGIDCSNVAAASVACEYKLGFRIVDDDVRILAHRNLF